jgi:hypothetical protein
MIADLTSHLAVAYQRKIADRERETKPRPRLTAPLTQFSVETITKAEAKTIILNYEWLRNVGRAKHFIGLFSPERELVGAACFGYGPSTPAMRTLLGGPAWCLERGACVSWAPENAASFLIQHACRRIYKITGISRFFAYADPCAGEYGAVYQAANWLYLGQGLNGKKGRQYRTYVLRPGLDPDVASNWQTTKALRQDSNRITDPETGKSRGLTYAEARKAGWRIVSRPGKHVYAINIGRDAKKWRKKMKPIAKPYPAPRSELKRKLIMVLSDAA